MARWDTAIALDPASEVPVFLQIARAIADDVRRGRLRAGDALPGSRTLASSLAVHRNTVLAAYRELAAEGWIETRAAQGTVVSRELPDPPPRRFARAPARGSPSCGFDLPNAPEPLDPPALPRGTLVLQAGSPDVRLVPTAALARAYRRALRSKDVLGYGEPRGDLRLREALAPMLARLRGVAADPDAILVTRGSQMALDLVARTIVRPGDVVAVEALGYPPAWRAFEAAGARLVAVPLDRHGLRVDALEALVAREAVRAVYLTPHHQFPTTVTLSAARRLALLELARAARIAIVEDDYDFEFHYEGRPVLPLASADPAGVVLYVGTLSKILAPTLRLGFLVAPRAVIERASAIRTFVDRQGDRVVERAIAELLEDDEVQRHARRVRRLYRERRDALIEALASELGGAVHVDAPPGGMAIWAAIDDTIDVDAWAARAPAHGVAFVPGARYAFDGASRPNVRLGFASLAPEELRDAVLRMKAALPRRRPARRSP